MSVDHNRPLPVASERLDYFTALLSPLCDLFINLPYEERGEILKVAMLAEQVEYQQQIAFFLQEAHEIYNARFR